MQSTNLFIVYLKIVFTNLKKVVSLANAIKNKYLFLLLFVITVNVFKSIWNDAISKRFCTKV